MKGWPDGVLMPGQLRHPNARTKGITDLGKGDRRRLQQALVNGELAVIKLGGLDERCKGLSKYSSGDLSLMMYRHAF